MNVFISSEFTVPAVFETDEYRLRMLTVNDVVKDFDAVVTSAEHLKGIFPPPSTWPDGLTLEHTMMSLDESCCLGCVYFYPSERQGYDAYALLWARQSELASGLEERLLAAVRQWLTDVWPFESVGFPGRDLSWEDWFALPER